MKTREDRPTVWWLRPALSVAVCGVAGFLVSALFTAWHGVPEPAFHDEHSYLLAADTFRHLRLTNPAPELWPHFESPHVIVQPSYASKYPPAQGLLLAFGWAVGGHPIVGAWLGIALLSASLCWLLRAATSPRWALAGGMLAAVHFGWNTYWSAGYWSASLPAVGGALLLGAVLRIAKRPRVVDGVFLALGLAILANSRPFEGLLAAAVAGVALALSWWRAAPRDRQRMIVQSAVPAALVLLVAFLLTMGYNRAVTGSPWRMPYQVHEAEYSMAPVFLWQELGPRPEYRHRMIERFQGAFLTSMYRSQRTLRGYWAVKSNRLLGMWSVVLGPVLSLALIASFTSVFFVAFSSRQVAGVRLSITSLGVFLAGALSTQYLQPHYIAPFVGALWLLVLNGLGTIGLAIRRLDLGRIGLLRGWLLVAVLFGAVVVERVVRDDAYLAIAVVRGVSRNRPGVEDFLRRQGGRHLALVEYGEGADFHDEWVYNGAELEEEDVLWARSMSPEKDRQLIEHYSDRRAWRVKIGVADPRAIDIEPIEP